MGTLGYQWFFEEWSRGVLQGLRFGDGFAYWMTSLGASIIVLSGLELLRGRKRFGLLVLLNVLFLASAVTHVGTYIMSWVTYCGHEMTAVSPQERLAEAFIGGMSYLLGWFYIAFMFLLLLVLCQLRETFRRKTPQELEAPQ